MIELTHHLSGKPTFVDSRCIRAIQEDKDYTAIYIGENLGGGTFHILYVKESAVIIRYKQIQHIFGLDSNEAKEFAATIEGGI